jgi:Angiotensin-converting enzyme.
MPPDAYAKELDRLWEQVKPLYVSLHAYVRMKLREQYGKDVVPEKGPIPAHLLGNMWAQAWGNLYPVLAPKDADPGYDLTKILVEKKTDARQMVRYGEGFFTSLGFEPSRRRSGSARSSPARATARSSATRAPGASTGSTTCA